MEKDGSRSGATEGERSSTGVAPEVKRWSSSRKKEVVLRLMRGEPVDALSRELKWLRFLRQGDNRWGYCRNV